MLRRAPGALGTKLRAAGACWGRKFFFNQVFGFGKGLVSHVLPPVWGRAMNSRQLDVRFRSFLDACPWAENIDRLTLTEEQQRSLKADYLIEERRLVVEVKSADKEMGPDFEKALAPFMEEKDWPVFYGKANVAPFLEGHPRRNEIMPVLMAAVTKALETQIKKANQQVRATKETFGLPSSQGLVVYLNDRTEVVAPDVVAHRVARMFQSRHADGRFRYSSLHALLVMSEAHYISAGPVAPAAPCLFVGREGLRPDDPSKIGSDRIVSEWARHNHTPLMKLTIEELSELSSIQHPLSALRPSAATQRAALPQRWIREYASDRYLRTMVDGDLTKIGAALIGRLGANFLKGSALKLSQAEVAALFRAFMHFQEEMKLRGLGLQRIMIEHGDLAKQLIRGLSGRNLPDD